MITITERARQKIVQLEEHFSQPVKGLRVSAIPRSPIRASFTMKLIPEGEPDSPADIIQSLDEVDVYIDPDSAPYLEAAAIDYVFTPVASGFKVVAPPRKLDTPDGALALRIQKILDEQINRSLFLHGGGATLIDVQGGSVFLGERQEGKGRRSALGADGHAELVQPLYDGSLPILLLAARASSAHVDRSGSGLPGPLWSNPTSNGQVSDRPDSMKIAQGLRRIRK